MKDIVMWMGGLEIVICTTFVFAMGGWVVGTASLVAQLVSAVLAARKLSDF